MISPFIKIYVMMRCFKEIHKRLAEILVTYNEMPQVGNNKIHFSFLLFPTVLGASSAMKNRIAVSAEWAARLILFDSEDTQNTFQITLGHELSHKDGDFAFLFWERKNRCFIHKEDRKFVNWVTECHHDYAAVEKMYSCSKKKLLASMEYKIKLKPNNNDSNSHPSWNRRKGYVENYDFNLDLINKIASDTGCTNSILIKNICDYYKPILLI